MKKFLFGLITFAGVFVIVGSLGAMEQDMISIGTTLVRVFQGCLLVVVSRICNCICEIISSAKRTKERRSHRTDNVLSYSA